MLDTWFLRFSGQCLVRKGKEFMLAIFKGQKFPAGTLTEVLVGCGIQNVSQDVWYFPAVFGENSLVTSERVGSTIGEWVES